MKRLGLSYAPPGVDPENVPLFAKIIRLVGFALAMTLVAWGVFYDWRYSVSPFGQLALELGARRSEHEAWSYLIGGPLILAGWYFRFYVGSAFTGLLFGLAALISRAFKSV